MARSPCAHARNGTPDNSGSHDRHIQRETYKLEGELAARPEGRVCSNLAKIAHGRGSFPHDSDREEEPDRAPEPRRQGEPKSISSLQSLDRKSTRLNSSH